MVSVTHDEQMGLNPPAEPHTGDYGIQECGECILLVEDDMPTLRLERVILEEAGYLVQGVASGEAALEHIAEEPPALVILDNGLPGMDGFTTCRRIREFSQVPVVMVTGNKSAADRKRGKASGADAYVTKPFLADNLVDLVAEFIAESAETTWEGEDSQPIDTPPPDPKKANAPTPSTPVLDVRDPIGGSASLPAKDAAQPDSNQTGGDQPIESALHWPNDDSSAPVDEDAPEDDPTEVKVAWKSQDSPEQQSPLKDPAPAEEPTDEPDGELYEGTVRLTVTSSGPVKNMLNFVGELRQNSQLRLLRLVASQRSESMDIWLGLREPLHLITILGDIPGVSQVAALPDPDGDEEERQVTVEVGQ